MGRVLPGRMKPCTPSEQKAPEVQKTGTLAGQEEGKCLAIARKTKRERGCRSPGTMLELQMLSENKQRKKMFPVYNYVQENEEGILLCGVMRYHTE